MTFNCGSIQHRQSEYFICFILLSAFNLEQGKFVFHRLLAPQLHANETLNVNLLMNKLCRDTTVKSAIVIE
jgi:hypothetical protein